MGVGVAEDQVQVILVGQDHVIEDADSQLAEVDGSGGDLLDLGSLLLTEALADASRDPAGGVHVLASEHRHNLVSQLERLQHLAPKLHSHLGDDPEDVTLGGVSLRPHHEVWPSQGVEVGGVVGHVEGTVQQPSQLDGCRWRLHLEYRIQGLGGGHVVGLRADATDALRDDGHLLRWPPLAEPLEPPQLRHLEVGVRHVPLIVEEDLDAPVPLQTGDGVDTNAPGFSLGRGCSLWSHGLPPHKLWAAPASTATASGMR